MVTLVEDPFREIEFITSEFVNIIVGNTETLLHFTKNFYLKYSSRILNFKLEEYSLNSYICTRTESHE